MSGSSSNGKWIPIPPLQNTTFPTLQFAAYIWLTAILLPVYVPILLLQLLFKCVMYCINKLFYFGINGTLTPIEAKPGNYVVITGAASGIGKEMARIYAHKGFSVILVDINEQGLKQFGGQLKNEYANQTFPTIVADLASDTAAEDIFNQITRVSKAAHNKSKSKNKGKNKQGKSRARDGNQWGISNVVILVNNAGFGMTGVFLNQPIEQIRNMCKVNCLSCLALAHHFGRYFVERGKGRICQVASVAAYEPGPLAAAYHGTKAMMRMWALSFQHELLGTGVGMTVVCPGAVNTNFGSASNSDLSHVFTTFGFLSYSGKQIATHAVDATLAGKREVFVGPLVAAVHYFLSLYGETYNVIAARFLWATPSAVSRSPLKKFKYKKSSQ